MGSASAGLNVATTIAGVEDGVVLSPEYADKFMSKWGLKVIKDLRGMFDGSVTGSAKNDAYRWAIENYLSKGLCSAHFLSLFEDGYLTRDKGNISYVITRDWAVANRSFVFDLSPWGDELPLDDPDQILGTDLKTYKLILQENLKQTAGRQMAELSGFFSFQKYVDVPGHKSSHEPVPTEWETVYLITPYNCYQNTVASDCYNQSFHRHFPFSPLKQKRPAGKPKLENKVYVCFHMSDHDSTTPLYDFLPKFWRDENRGKIPLAWGLNPNLIETYPDIISYFYGTMKPNDYFVADASAAGYFNPNRVKKENLPLFVEHNRYFYEQTDMTISPMVLDWDEPSEDVKDAFAEFSPDGYATIIYDFHKDIGKPPEQHVWKNMSVMNMNNAANVFESGDKNAKDLLDSIGEISAESPEFVYVRVAWASPAQILEFLEGMRKLRPDLDFVPVDPYAYFGLFRDWYNSKRKTV